MKSPTKVDPNGVQAKPYDVAQMTILIDASGSMGAYEDAARKALTRLIKESVQKDGMVLAIRSFDTRLRTIHDFGVPKDLVGKPLDYNVDGGTAMIRAIGEGIGLSRTDAALVPDLRVHHVVVVITDGEDMDSTPDDIQKCKREIANVDVDATFILIDFSGTGHAGQAVGLKSIPLRLDPKGFNDAMNKVSAALGTIADNIVNELPPQTNLALPPAR